MCCIFDYGIVIFDRRQMPLSGAKKAPDFYELKKPKSRCAPSIAGCCEPGRGPEKAPALIPAILSQQAFLPQRDSPPLLGTVFPLIFGLFSSVRGINSSVVGGVYPCRKAHKSPPVALRSFSGQGSYSLSDSG